MITIPTLYSVFSNLNRHPQFKPNLRIMHPISLNERFMYLTHIFVHFSCVGFSSTCPQMWSLLILNEINVTLATTKLQRKADICAIHCQFHSNIISGLF